MYFTFCFYFFSISVLLGTVRPSWSETLWLHDGVGLAQLFINHQNTLTPNIKCFFLILSMLPYHSHLQLNITMFRRQLKALKYPEADEFDHTGKHSFVYSLNNWTLNIVGINLWENGWYVYVHSWCVVCQWMAGMPAIWVVEVFCDMISVTSFHYITFIIIQSLQA